jgi:hypothetical protein
MLASFIVRYLCQKSVCPAAAPQLGSRPLHPQPARIPTHSVVGKHGACRIINFILLQAMSEMAMATKSPLEAQDTRG